jgi:predicted transcriptional regulator
LKSIYESKDISNGVHILVSMPDINIKDITQTFKALKSIYESNDISNEVHILVSRQGWPDINIKDITQTIIYKEYHANN